MAKLFFYYSAMNAGKSTNLVQSSYNYQERGMNTLVFSPCIDDRYGLNSINTRIGINSPATSFDKNFDFTKYINNILNNNQNNLTNNPHCILIDEAQFLTKEQVWQLSDITDNYNIPVLTYGLRSDFQGEPFEGSIYLLAIADQLIEIKTICHCGSKATMNMRIDEFGNKVKIGEQIEIGGNDKYTSTCRKHFKAGVSSRAQNNKDINKDINKATNISTQKII